MKIFFVSYSGWGGELFLIKSKTLDGAKKILKRYCDKEGKSIYDFNDPTELKLTKSINSLGWYGE